MPFPRPFSFYVNVTIATLAIACLISTTGCQTMAPDQSQAITQMSSELEESNQKIEEIYHRLSVVQFMVDSHERTIADLERKLRHSGLLDTPLSPGTAYKPHSKTSPTMADRKKEDRKLLTPVPPANDEMIQVEEIPEEPVDHSSAETLYNQGFARLKEKNYTRAISLFKKVVTQYPEHNLADNAIYWTGEIHYTQHRYEEAIRTFNRLISAYPEGGKVPDALLKIGYAYHSLNDKENAVKYLKKVVVDYPFTVPGSKAEAMLNRIE